jgi:soluble lytic murein transglycosylase-like protein
MTPATQQQRLRRLLPPLLLLVVGLPGPVAAKPLAPAELTEQALRHLHGEGVRRDPERALVYLCVAAARGHAPAAFELGWVYLQGRGLGVDETLAAAWMREARRLGQAIPEGLADLLSAADAERPVCRGRNGQPLPVRGRQRAELLLKVYDLAPQYGLDPALVIEVIRAESNFDPRARSHKGALGLMQLIPETARRFGVSDPFEPMQNLHGGMAYLSWLLDRFGGDLALTLAGYNAGEGAVERHGGVPPYNETREYVQRILQRYGAGGDPAQTI